MKKKAAYIESDKLLKTAKDEKSKGNSTPVVSARSRLIEDAVQRTHKVSEVTTKQ